MSEGPSTMHMDVHVNSGEVDVQHFPPPKCPNPFTSVRIRTGQASVTLYLSDPDIAQKIASACMCVVRRWQSFDKDGD